MSSNIDLSIAPESPGRPFGVGEELASRRAVEVLGGAAALLRVDQLDAVIFLEYAHVVGDQVEALVELLGQQIWAGYALVQNDQDLYSQRMGEGFGDDLFDAVLLLGFWHWGASFGRLTRVARPI
jgi:hypothetical protein